MYSVNPPQPELAFLTFSPGKIISKKKFLSIAESGFGFCSIVFGWDMHDRTYFRELSVSNAANGYRDMLAKVDLNSYRRIPWECYIGTDRRIPFFLVSFHDPETEEPIAPCPRGLLAQVVEKMQPMGWKALAGAEYEFYNFSETPRSLAESKGQALEHITPGMFGYSVTRPVQNQDFYYGVFDACRIPLSQQSLPVADLIPLQAGNSASPSKAGTPSPDLACTKQRSNSARSHKWPTARRSSNTP